MAPGRRRAVAAAALVVLGSVLAPVAVLAVRARADLADTGRFVAIVAPVLREPLVREALVDRLGNAIVDAVDVRRLADGAVDGLAESAPQVARGLRALTGPLASGLDSAVRAVATRVLSDPRTDAAQEQVVRVAHEQLIAALSGADSAVGVRGDEVVLDLTPFVGAATLQLTERGFDVGAALPELHLTIPVLDADTLSRARTGYGVLNAVAPLLPWVTALLLAGGVAVSRDRRLAVVAAGLGVGIGMAALAVATVIGRAALLAAAPVEAAVLVTALVDAVAAPLHDTVVTIGVAALFVALAAFLAPRSASVGRVVRAHHRALQIGAVVVAVTLVVVPSLVDAGYLLAVAAVLVAVLGTVEMLARTAAQNPTDDACRTSPPSGPTHRARIAGRD